MAEAKSPYCPRCGSVDVVCLKGLHYFICRECEWKGVMPQGTPDFIELYASKLKEETEEVGNG